jgi:hypothetical protein
MNELILRYLKQYIWGIGDDADNYFDGSYNSSAILKLIYIYTQEHHTNPALQTTT